MGIEHRRCVCGTEYSVLAHGGAVVCVESEDDRPGCYHCGSEDHERLVRAGTGVDLGGYAGVGRIYPYFDRALKCHIESAADRKRICAERGLVPVDGDIDDSDARKRFAEEDVIRDRWTDLQEKYEKDPEFAEFRRLRAKGYYSDMARREREGA
jgi:hypothetical protein